MSLNEWLAFSAALLALPALERRLSPRRPAHGVRLYAAFGAMRKAA